MHVSLPGPELSPAKLTALMYERIDVPSEFKCPYDGILTLRGMLTGGTSQGTDGSDITFATLFEWVWDLVKEFPGANLYFDNRHKYLSSNAQG